MVSALARQRTAVLAPPRGQVKNRAPVRALTFFDFVILERTILIEPKVSLVGVVLAFNVNVVEGFGVVKYCFVSLKGDD